jgi:hypothetical protein
MKDRRGFLTIATGAAVACTGLALAITSRAATDDQIFRAIDNHQQAVDHTVREGEKLLAGADPDDGQMQAALMAELTASTVLVATIPTTRAGLQALDVYLRGDSRRLMLCRIEYPVVYDGVRIGTATGGPEGIDYLIAKRAAEIAA